MMRRVLDGLKERAGREGVNVNYVYKIDDRNELLVPTTMCKYGTFKTRMPVLRFCRLRRQKVFWT